MAEQGYTVEELKARDERRVMRRSVFKKYRRLEEDLRLDPFWPLYLRLRRLVTEELARKASPVLDDAAIDCELEGKLPELCSRMQEILANDRTAREARARIALGDYG